MDMAKLGFVVDSTDVKRAEGDVKALGSAAVTTEAQVGRASEGIRGSAGRIQAALASSAGKSAQAWGRFKESFNGTGGLAAVASTGALTLSVNKMIEAARSASEAQALFDQVFQENAEGVREWSTELAQQINRSATELQGQAAQFQQVLASMIPDRAQASEMSTTLAGLAQDISAFYDISEGDALAKLRSGLTGETEPLKALGIVLSANAVEAKALQMGLAGTATALTEADKVAARYALIMQLTADAQGAATREASSLSNQQKGLNGALNDAYRALGQNLLPAMTSIVTAIAGIVRAFNELSPETQRFIAYAVALGAALGPLLTTLGLIAMAIPPITTAIGLLLSPVGLAAAAIAGLVAAGVALYQNWDELKARFPVLEQAVAAVGKLFDWLRGKVQQVAAAIREVGSLVAEAKNWGTDTVQGAVDGINGFESRLEGAVAGMAGKVKSAFTSEMEIQSPSRVFMRFGQFISQGLGIGIAQGAASPVSAMQGLSTGVQGIASDMRSGLSSILKAAVTDFDNLGDAVANVLDNIASKILDSNINSLVGNLFDGFGSLFGGNDALSGALRKAIPSFAGGGYTGNAPRTGGLDGRGGRLALLHPRETVVDHTRRGQGGGMSYNPTFNIGGSVTAEDLAAVRREAAAGYMQMQRSMPGRVAQINRDPLRR